MILQILFLVLILIFSFEFGRIIIGLFKVGTTRVIKCKVCLDPMDSSSLKCSNCGSFTEIKRQKLNRFFSYIENLGERKKHRVIKKTNFWHGEF
jgi:hypothetical protein